MARTGRKSDLEKYPERGERIAEAVEAGCSLSHAMHLAGVPESVAFAWMAKGEKSGAKACYRDFADRIKTARRAFVLLHLATIKRHSRATFPAAAWLLERCCPLEFGPPAVRLGVESLRQEIAELNQLLRAKGLQQVPQPNDFDTKGVIIDAEPEEDPEPRVDPGQGRPASPPHQVDGQIRPENRQPD